MPKTTTTTTTTILTQSEIDNLFNTPVDVYGDEVEEKADKEQIVINIAWIKNNIEEAVRVSKHSSSQSKPNNMFKKRKIIDEVTDDLISRSEKGKETYGTYLYPFNGRNPLIDAYQESLDNSMYLKQFIVEEELRNAFVKVCVIISSIVVACIFIGISYSRKENCS